MRDGVLAQRLALRVHPQHQRPPAAGARQPGQNADERGFARAVRPQQAQNAAFGHVKRHLIQRHKGRRAAAQGRVTLADGLKGEGGGHGARDCRSCRPPAREQEIRAASRSARGRKRADLGGLGRAAALQFPAGPQTGGKALCAPLNMAPDAFRDLLALAARLYRLYGGPYRCSSRSMHERVDNALQALRPKFRASRVKLISG